MTYTYDPTKIGEHSLHRMRFELGDTLVEGGATTCALSDEEYEAILTQGQKWKYAKLSILEAICMKMSYQVDTKIDVLAYSFSERARQWQKMLEDMKKSVKISLPSVNSRALGDYYFKAGMHNNKRGI